MIRRFLRFSCLPLFLTSFLISSAPAKEATNFVGNWVLRVGDRLLVVLTLTRAEHGDSVVGSLTRPKFSYQSGDEPVFFAIHGPALRYPVVRSQIKENCLVFTTRNPSDEKDEDNYRLCSSANGRATLGYDFPGIEPWPVNLEKTAPPVTTDWESRAYVLDDTDVSNPEMQLLWQQDQKARQLPPDKIDWPVVTKADNSRREATRKLLAEGKLRSAADFERASLIFQHSDASDDYLLAHTLAIIAVARGRVSATWMAAATLDRYLQTIHQPQVYGTQTNLEHHPATQEPYNRTLISDSLRRLLNVPSLAAQEEQRKQYDSGQSQ